MCQLFELPEGGTSCNGQNSSKTVDIYYIFMILGQFTTEQAKIRGLVSVHYSCNVDVFLARQHVTVYENRVSFLFYLRSCCRPIYGLLLAFPLPPSGADVLRQGLNIVRTDVCVQ